MLNVEHALDAHHVALRKFVVDKAAMLERLRTALKGTRAYDAWSLLRGEQQRRAYVRLLDSFLRDSMAQVNAPAVGLGDLAAKRRSFVGDDGRPHIVAFGAEAWEQHGLWSSFAEQCRFQLSRYGEEAGPAPSGEDECGMRDRQARGFLAALDAAETAAPVTCAFFYASGAHVSDLLLEELGRRGIWTVMMSLDDKHQLVRPRGRGAGEPHQMRVARQVDLYWTTWRAGLPLLTSAGARVWYQPEGAHPDFHTAKAMQRDVDVVFVGQAYGQRRRLVEYLRARGFRVEARGRGWPGGHVTFAETVELFNRAKVVLGVGGVGHMRGIAHLKGRDFEVPMCGALYLTSFNPELADFYAVGREILCYSSFEDCAEVLAWILRDPAEAERIRQAGHARALRDHDWRKRVRDLFELFSREKT